MSEYDLLKNRRLLEMYKKLIKKSKTSDSEEPSSQFDESSSQMDPPTNFASMDVDPQPRHKKQQSSLSSSITKSIFGNNSVKNIQVADQSQTSSMVRLRPAPQNQTIQLSNLNEDTVTNATPAA
jgi:hypothetical protein